ncbi:MULTISPECIES: ArsR/SmtB family transcription factor [Thermomonosporaceae]|uniref:ArsR/SmtB family transcription factor n=1 Tax=Thermomonosporaceae TaxID=2012 RepID=UPI00255B1B81|nr:MULTISPECIES: metalloregulator ArsR/SmtB family transcription factor [Thermomonosporaceae]MDL4771454.1 metalloregulator ArsR/SmtB family transcription factor [Actinomadura xylanilytica]
MIESDARHVAMLRALGHPVRLGIVQRLAVEPETCACDFTAVFGVSQPTISQHLKVLREAGLVTTRRHGTQICYSVAPAEFAELAGLLAGLGRAVLAPAAG